MKIKNLSRILLIFILVITIFSCGGVYALWSYTADSPEEKQEQIDLSLSTFEFKPEIVYITDAVSFDGKTVINGFTECYLDSIVTLSSDKSSTATVKITVYNNATETYAFNAVKYHTDEYSNNDIVYTLPVLKHGDEVAAGESMEFEIIFGYGKGVTPTNYVLDSYLQFEFLPLDELPEEEVIAVSGALDQFKNIINDVVEDGSFKKLIDQMDANGTNDRHDDSYIGNVSGASENDVLLLEELFQGNLTLNIDGVDTEVTIIIKRENVDGNVYTGDADGNEMAIYMTTEDLKRDSWWGSSKAVVYVSVFTSDDDGELWYQLGAMYEGTATVKGYDGNVFGEGSFDTDTWRSTENKTIESIIQG